MNIALKINMATPKGYRKLKKGETIKEGDLFASLSFGYWTNASMSVGSTVDVMEGRWIRKQTKK